MSSFQCGLGLPSLYKKKNGQNSGATTAKELLGRVKEIKQKFLIKFIFGTRQR